MAKTVSDRSPRRTPTLVPIMRGSLEGAASAEGVELGKEEEVVEAELDPGG